MFHGSIYEPRNSPVNSEKSISILEVFLKQMLEYIYYPNFLRLQKNWDSPSSSLMCMACLSVAISALGSICQFTSPFSFAWQWAALPCTCRVVQRAVLTFPWCFWGEVHAQRSTHISSVQSVNSDKYTGVDNSSETIVLALKFYFNFKETFRFSSCHRSIVFWWGFVCGGGRRWKGGPLSVKSLEGTMPISSCCLRWLSPSGESWFTVLPCNYMLMHLISLTHQNYGCTKVCVYRVIRL